MRAKCCDDEVAIETVTALYMFDWLSVSLPTYTPREFTRTRSIGDKHCRKHSLCAENPIASRISIMLAQKDYNRLSPGSTLTTRAVAASSDV